MVHRGRHLQCPLWCPTDSSKWPLLEKGKKQKYTLRFSPFTSKLQHHLALLSDRIEDVTYNVRYDALTEASTWPLLVYKHFTNKLIHLFQNVIYYLFEEITLFHCENPIMIYEIGIWRKSNFDFDFLFILISLSIQRKSHFDFDFFQIIHFPSVLFYVHLHVLSIWSNN